MCGFEPRKVPQILLSVLLEVHLANRIYEYVRVFPHFLQANYWIFLKSNHGRLMTHFCWIIYNQPILYSSKQSLKSIQHL
jgi:hypothetical protein